MKIAIKTNVLKASVFCVAGKKETREVMQHIYLDFRHGAVNRLRVVSVHGHYLSAFKQDLEYLEDDQTADFQLIVPIDVVKSAAKSKAQEVILESMPDGRYMLGDVVFAPIQGTFPDYDRVIPSHNLPMAKEPHQFNWECLAIGQDAMRAFYGDNKRNFRLTHLEDVGAMHTGSSDAVFVVMPLRKSAFAEDNSENYQGFF